MMAELRRMTASDLDAVMTLAARSSGAPHWPRQIYEGATEETAIEPDRTIALVAFDGDVLAGFAIGALAVDVCAVESIVVAGEYRRQGMGTALLQSLHSWAVEHSARKMELEVRAGNAAAIALYQRAGFVREGTRPGYYRDPEEDAILMGLFLPASGDRVEKNT